MVSLTYVDQADSGEVGCFVEHHVSDLVFTLLEPADHSDGLDSVERLA